MIMGYEYQEKFVDKANEILANQMKTKSCLKKYCCMCKKFKAVRNEFENTIICACILYRKGVVGTDVTLITPDLMLSGIDWRTENDCVL